MEVQKADQISWYKAMNLYEKGYNIVFKVNEANEVTVESQPAMEARILWRSFCFRQRCFGRRGYYCEAVA